MKNKVISLAAAAVLAAGAALPSFADGDKGPVGACFGFVGAAVAGFFDIPEGIVVDTLWYVPVKCQRTLASSFGNSKGFTQNCAAFVLGVPVGMVFGVPYGAIHGGRHAFTTGWEEPFSVKSFIVTEEK